MKSYLYRLKIFEKPLFQSLNNVVDRREIILNGLRPNSGIDTTRGRWCIGNTDLISNDFLYFRIGRITKRKSADFQDGFFIDTYDDDKIYTHVFVALNYQLFAITTNARVAARVDDIARKIAKIIQLNAHEYDVEMRVLYDPFSFISKINNCYKINKFWYSLSRKNDFDIDRDLLVPSQKVLVCSKGVTLNNRIEGDELDKECIKQITTSVVSSGEQASASIQDVNSIRFKKIKSGNDPVKIVHKEIDAKSLIYIFDMILAEYNRIKHGDER